MTQETFGDYILERKLGAGGMAVTYKAREQLQDIGAERIVTVKQILPHYGNDANFRTMFLDEARISTLLTHRNICRVYRAGEIDGTLFMAMEFIDGRELFDIMSVARERGQSGLPPEHALFMVAEVLEGLHTAHTQKNPQGVELGLVHRDVSPQNVLISKKGEVKLIDFGVAKATTNLNKTEAGAVKGKVAYFSPEQLQAKALDGRSDIFAAGLMLYELLTGVHPFMGPDEHAIIYNFISKEAEPPSSVRPELSHDIDALVMKAIAKERDERFSNAQKMARACMTLVHTIHPGYQQHHLETYIEQLFDTNAPLPQGAPLHTTKLTGGPPPGMVSPSPGVVSAPSMQTPSASGGNRGLVLAVAALAFLILAGISAIVIFANQSDDDDDDDSGSSSASRLVESESGFGSSPSSRTGASGQNAGNGGGVPVVANNSGNGGFQPPTPPTWGDDEDDEQDNIPDIDTEGIARSKFLTYQRCLNRAVPRARQSYDRYLKWAPKKGLPTCKERYISYGLYSIYDDASERCKSALEIANEVAHPELDTAMRELTAAFDALTPVVAEAVMHFDLEEYKTNCVTTQAIHTRLLPAFETLFAKDEAARTLLAPLWLETLEKDVARLKAEGATELHQATAAYVLESARLEQTLPEPGGAMSAEARKRFLKHHLDFQAASRNYMLKAKTNSDEAFSASLTWLTKAAEALHKASGNIARDLQAGKDPSKKDLDEAREQFAEVTDGYLSARF